ncbi:MAG: DUF2867 domain-containing protein [Pseudomonadota bacterium]
MKPQVSACDIPASCEIALSLSGAHFYDCYHTPIESDAPSALEIYLAIVKKTPTWMNAMMALRNRVVSLVGLKNLGHLGEVKDKPASAYRVGDRVGIFSLRYLSESEIILGDSDKHLNVCVSVCKQTSGKQHTVALSTVVHIHNTLGRVYMFFVAPVHKIIAPAVLAKGM